MSFSAADSNLGRLSYIAELANQFGQTPASPQFRILRPTSANFDAQKETVVSNEVRSDRMVSTVAEVAAMSQGTLEFELSLGGSFDDFIEAALCGNFGTATNADNVAVTNATTLTGPANSFTNVVAGQWLLMTGFTNPANNGWVRAAANGTSTTMTVAGGLVAEGAAVGKRVRGRMVRNGTVRRSFSIEQAFTDINQFFIFRGQRVGTMGLEIAAGQIVSGSFGFQGTSSVNQGTTFSTGGAPIAPTTTDVVNATAALSGYVFDPSAPQTALADITLQSLSFNLDNALRNQMAVASKFPQGIGYGRQTVSGSVNAYFRNSNLYTRFINHGNAGFTYGFTDNATVPNGLRITIPRTFLNTSNPAIPGIDQDVMEQIEWTAVLDPTTNCQIQVDVAGP